MTVRTVPETIGVPTAVLAASLLLLCTGAASAQITGRGLRAGLNLSTLDTSGAAGDAPVERQMRGLFAGFLTWPVTPWLELQPEAIYTMKGAKTGETGVAAKALLDYFEVPILGRVTRGASGARRFYAAAGVALGVLVRAKTRADFGRSTEEIDIRDEVETLDWGAVVGGGFELGSVVVDVRYTHGLRDIDRDAADDVKVRNRAASLSAGVRF